MRRADEADASTSALLKLSAGHRTCPVIKRCAIERSVQSSRRGAKPSHTGSESAPNDCSTKPSFALPGLFPIGLGFPPQAPTSRCLARSTALSDNHSLSGRVAEWFKAPVLKTGVPARVPWVRIPPLPPKHQQNQLVSSRLSLQRTIERTIVAWWRRKRRGEIESICRSSDEATPDPNTDAAADLISFPTSRWTVVFRRDASKERQDGP